MLIGSTTFKTAAAATAASIAFPPFFKISSPAFAANGLLVETRPFKPKTADLLELNFSFTTSSNFIPNQTGIDTIGVIGIVPVTIYQPITLTESLNYGLNGTLNSFGMIMLTFKMLGNGSASISDLGGPIMIGKIAGEAAETGWMPLFTLMALISVNLAFLNILPIPGLDGGQIFIILIEAIIRKPLSLKARLAVQQLGMVFLLMIMVTVMFNDISRLFN